MSFRFKVGFVAGVLGALAASADTGVGAPRPPRPPDTERPRAVVLLVGDGLGFSQIAVARRAVVGESGRFAFESLPVTGIVRTSSATNAVTDSGAAATAFGSGVKTDNRVVGLDAAGSPVLSIAELARQHGWRVGYVTTTRITHATPAAFYAHHENRDAENEIAAQLLDGAPDVALGGGLTHFLPESMSGQRTDGRDLTAEARRAGYSLWVRGQQHESRAPARLLGLLAYGHLAYRLDDQRLPESSRDPSLETLTRRALEVLDHGGSFFAMIEGGRIDHAGHSFDAAGVVAETAAFDSAVEVVLELRGRRPDLLVLVTADHATGGLAINEFADWPALTRQRASVEWLVDQLLNGGADQALLNDLTGYTDFLASDVEAVREAGATSIYAARRELGRRLGERNGITWVPRVDDSAAATKGHTGEDVPIYAVGPGAQRFGGSLDNSEIFSRLKELLGW